MSFKHISECIPDWMKAPAAETSTGVTRARIDGSGVENMGGSGQQNTSHDGQQVGSEQGPAVQPGDAGEDVHGGDDEGGHLGPEVVGRPPAVAGEWDSHITIPSERGGHEIGRKARVHHRRRHLWVRVPVHSGHPRKQAVVRVHMACAQRRRRARARVASTSGRTWPCSARTRGRLDAEQPSAQSTSWPASRRGSNATSRGCSESGSGSAPERRAHPVGTAPSLPCTLSNSARICSATPWALRVMPRKTPGLAAAGSTVNHASHPSPYSGDGIQAPWVAGVFLVRSELASATSSLTVTSPAEKSWTDSIRTTGTPLARHCETAAGVRRRWAASAAPRPAPASSHWLRFMASV